MRKVLFFIFIFVAVGAADFSLAQTPTNVILVKGTARLVDENPVDAFVWAWSEKGKSVSAQARFDGTFELSLTRDDTWHVDAGKIINETAYTYSDIIVLAVDAVSVGPLEITLISELLPPPVIVTRPATEEVTVKVEDGASVIIPPKAAVLTGTVTVEIQPIVGAPSFIDEIASFLAVKIVSTVYDLVIKDQQGKEIKEFREAVEILLPYKDEELKKLGVSEDKIYAAFFDELKGVWVKIGDYAIDKLKNVIRARVKHLTRFAIVAPADVSPPESPSNKKAEILKDGSVKLSWINPKRDFHHVKIYRSEILSAGGGSASGGKNFGSVAFNDLTGIFVLDKGLSGGKIYYYLIHSIDPAGNESENTVQLSVKTPAIVIKEAPKIPEEETEPEKQGIKETVKEVVVQPAPVSAAETPAPVIEKSGFFFRIWQAIARFFRSIF